MVSAPGKSPQPFANLWFFPLAAAYAALVLPWSVLGQWDLIAAPPGLQTSLGHAHEMLFGFALAVVAGYVLGPQPVALTLSLALLWALARLAFLMGPAQLPSLLLQAGFVGLLAFKVLPRFLKAAKKWRNKTVAPIISGLCLAAVLFHLLTLSGHVYLQHALLLEAILLISSLMFFMGGRMIAPAVAGHLTKQGRTLEARVQPQLEGLVLITLAIILVVNLVPQEWARRASGGLLLAIALLTLVRLLRWQIWHCLDRPDLLALALGYLWLVAGWSLTGLSLTWNLLPLPQALHALTIGALGTLTLSVMARSRLHRVRRDPNASPVIYLAVALLSLAALIRILGKAPTASYLAAAVCWSLAYLILLGVLLKLAVEERKKKKPVG